MKTEYEKFPILRYVSLVAIISNVALLIDFWHTPFAPLLVLPLAYLILYFIDSTLDR